MRTLVLTLALIALALGSACTQPAPAPAERQAIDEPTLASVAAAPVQARSGAALSAADEGGCGAHANERACGGEPAGAGGCGAHADTEAPPRTGALAIARTTFDGVPAHGESALCVVMNRAFVVDDKTATSTHAGKTYAFCCDGCKQMFDANPSQFVQADVATTATPTL